MKVTASLEKNMEEMRRLLPIEKSFDLIQRPLQIGSENAYLVFVDGFAKDDIMIHVVKALQQLERHKKDSSTELLRSTIPYIETSEETDFNQICFMILSGQIALFTDGNDTAVMIDAREYPVRNPSESHIEKSTRGPRDDLVETVIFNTALIRRRIRDFGLTFEMKTVGNMSKTDVAIGYIRGKADEKLLKKIRKRIDEIDVHALTMGEKSLEEALMKKSWYNPMPQFRVSERPDTIAAHIMEGHIVLLVDASPTAMILPTTLFYFTQYVEDYYQTPIVGTLTRFVRFMAIPIAHLLVPLFLLLCMNPVASPAVFRSFIPSETAEISMFAQLLILELGLEILRLSSLHTPQNMEAAFSIIGGLILGDFAVSMGLFVSDAIFFAVASAIANHCIPNPELANAIKVFRWFLLLGAGLFGIWGFSVALAVEIAIVCTTKTIDGEHYYLWPVIPFNGKDIKHLFFRYPLSKCENKKHGK